MRKIVGAAGLAGALLLTACSETGTSVDESLKRDLDLAFAASPIRLQESPRPAQIVSAVERTAPQAAKRTPTQRVVKHTPAPARRQAPAPVSQPEIVEQVEEAPVEVAVRNDAISVAEEDMAVIPSSRPQPVNPAPVGGGDGDYDRGNRDGIGSIISVVLRGGHAGIDDCDPRVDRRRGRGAVVSINNRIPVVGTFPGSGRLTASLPRSGGRVRF